MQLTTILTIILQFIDGKLIDDIPIRFKTADVPYLCMAYKIPPGLPVSVAINVKGYGWKTIIMTSGSNGFSWENALNSDEIIDDDT